MKLSRQDIIKLANLSRLKLTDEEVERYQTELSSILDYVAQLDKVDVSDLKPTYQVTGLTSQDVNASRDDEVTEQISKEELFKNLPDQQDGYIKVKRMIS